jgi:hypothetical protein
MTHFGKRHEERKKKRKSKLDIKWSKKCFKKVKKLSKSCQKVVKKIVPFSKRAERFERWKNQRKKESWPKAVGRKGQEERKKKKEKYEGFPRPGGDFVAPGKNI